MPQRLKDDERLVIAAYASNEPLPPTVSRSREIALVRKWSILGWFDRTTGKLTKRGKVMAIKHAPARPMGIEEIDTDIYHEQPETTGQHD